MPASLESSVRSVLGLIPARGGSKGVPGKNVRSIHGRPLLAYTVQAAREAGTIERVIVSTDDDAIAAVACAGGADLPFRRPATFAGDLASSLSVIHHALDWLYDHEGYRPDAVALLSPTCPLRTAAQIDATTALLTRSGTDSALTVYPVRDHPYFIYGLAPDGRLLDHSTVTERPLRRQELPAFYAPCQAVIVSRTDYLLSAADPMPVFNPESMAGYVIDEATAFDIDTPTDLVIAAALLAEAEMTMNSSPQATLASVH